MWEQATTVQISGRRAKIEGLGGGPPVAPSGLLHLDLPVEGDETATACFEQQQQQTPHSAQPSRVQTASARYPERLFTQQQQQQRLAPKVGAPKKTTKMYVPSTCSLPAGLAHAKPSLIQAFR